MTFPNMDNFLLEQVERGDLTDSQLENILDLMDELPEPTKTVLGYLTDIAAMAKTMGFEDEYFLFGGYAVLTHLVSQYGDTVAKLWRGSDDIDMNGSRGLLNSIRSVYKIENDRLSENLADKRTLKITDREGNEDTCKIDYMMREFDEKDIEEVVVLGVPVRVLNPLELMKAKLDLYKKEEKQAMDLGSLLGVCEYRKLDPNELAKSLSHEQVAQMHEFISTLDRHTDPRISTAPSTPYILQLRAALERRM